MKPPRKKLRALTGVIGFFLLIAAIVTATVLVYSSIADRSARDISLIMIFVILGMSLFCTLVDYLRRRFTERKPVEEILRATERIAASDFSVELQILRKPKNYNEFDLIAENINKMAAELRNSSLMRTDFISNVSHEMKTPLAVIRNYATALQDPSLDKETQRRYAGTLAETSKKLTDLVTNILKLNKLENQEIRPEETLIRLDEQLAECVLGFEEFIEKKEIDLNCDFEEVSVTSAADYLELVWNNLLSNAVKFTPHGGKITVTLKRENGKAVVTVSDTGCGISPETGKHIFDKFYQGDTSHAAQGNGLGLALVKKVIDVVGGEIFVESILGKGSTFTVKLGLNYEMER